MGEDERRIARVRDHAYLISLGKDAGTPEENWARAEHEIAEEQADELRHELAERGREAANRSALTHP